jgi:hypothetical protein
MAMMKLSISRQILRALQDLPAQFTGSLQFTLHFHDGTAGKVTVVRAKKEME